MSDVILLNIAVVCHNSSVGGSGFNYKSGMNCRLYPGTLFSFY